MDIKGEMAYFSTDEQRITGLPSPMPVNAISAARLENQLNARQERIDDMAAADDDQLTNSERAKLYYDREDLAKDRSMVNAITTQLLHKEIEFVSGLNNPTQ